MIEYGDIEIAEEDDEDEDEFYVTYDITTYPSDLSIQVLVDQFNDGDIVIPHFQRDFVWTIKQSSLLIESFLLGLPVPPVFFYIDSDNKNLVIDGQQRIRSVVDFLGGFFGPEDSRGRRRIFRLEGIDSRAPYSRSSFETLDDTYKRKIKNSVIRAINIRQISPDDSGTSMYHIFERLNTGGTPLSPQEIRNCVFHGNIVEKLDSLNRDSNWRQIIRNNKLDKRGRDAEMILRILGLSMGWRSYEKPMKEYLNKTMKKFRSANSSDLEAFETDFRKTAISIIEKLGEKPFRISGPLNVAVLDSVFSAALSLKGELPGDFYDRYNRLVRDAEYMSYVSSSTADTQQVRRRIEKAIDYLVTP